MADTTKAMATMIKNIEAKTGRTMNQLAALIRQSGLSKHSEIRSMLMEKYGLGYGAANAAVHLSLKSDGESRAGAAGISDRDVLAEIYSGKKAHLRPVHDRVLEALAELGDFETAPKKGYVSYRRKKQFAMVGPKTNTMVEIGFGAKSLPADSRLKTMPPNSMCRYTTRVSTVAEVDARLRGWLRASYQEAG